MFRVEDADFFSGANGSFGEYCSVGERTDLGKIRGANAPVDRGLFAEEVLPMLLEVSLDAMAQATGLSKGYCSFIRRGIKTPHPRHWDALISAAKSQAWENRTSNISSGGGHV